MDKNSKASDWLYTISSKKSLIDFNLVEIWRYKDLLWLFVKRDVVTVYKQTILGPLWYLIQPLFTALTFTLIFNTVANIKTGSVPPFLFNLVGITVWNYFRACLTQTSDTFTSNARIYSKVYFPRVISPLSVIISNLVKFGIQIVILIGFFLYYWLKGFEVFPDKTLIFFPVLIILMGLLGLGLGMIISSLVTKYKDLKFLVQFGVQLLMYLSAVMYPVALMKEKLPEYAWLVKYNPMATVIEASRGMILSVGQVSTGDVIYTVSVSFVILIAGIFIFNKTEKSFIDTI